MTRLTTEQLRGIVQNTLNAFDCDAMSFNESVECIMTALARTKPSPLALVHEAHAPVAQTYDELYGYVESHLVHLAEEAVATPSLYMRDEIVVGPAIPTHAEALMALFAANPDAGRVRVRVGG